MNEKKHLIIFFLISNYIYLYIKITKKLKVCICTIGKKENLYAKEYVDYYKNLGIDKIFIYDNNEKNGESFNLVLNDYINSGFVEIIDIRGIEAPQVKSMEDCRKNNFKKFDFLLFYDMDEFLFLRNYSNIKDFLNQRIFNKCQRIQLNWFFHTDNNLLNYDNRSLIQRFPEKDKRWKNVKLGGTDVIKSILKGNIDIELNNIHIINSNLVSCDGFGKIKEVQKIFTNESDHYYYYIDHYFCKSTEEFVNKIMRGSVSVGYNKTSHTMNRINVYFDVCDITIEKINYIEDKTKLNLTKFRLLIKNYSNSVIGVF